MTDNMNKQKMREQKCLEVVKKNLYMDNCFGLSEKDLTDLTIILNSVAPNENSSKFPDFIFDNGIIEHFAITSSPENRKGAQHKAIEEKFKRENWENAQMAAKKNPNDMFNFSRSYIVKDHSIDNVIKSIKRNWRKHADSLQKYSGLKEVIIFLIEYTDFSVFETMEVKNEKNTHYTSYRLNPDKDVLPWIHQNAQNVDYVILCTTASVEIIKIDSIPEVLEKAPVAYYMPSYTMSTERYIGFNFNKLDE